MRLRRKKRAGFADSSASSDIAFLLIIYFIVIAGFNINKGFLMHLPAKDSTRTVKRENLLRFELDDSGQTLLQGAVIHPAETERAIASAIAANEELAVMLTISPFTPWQYVVSFVEIAQKLKVEAFSFSMKEDIHDAAQEVFP
ncbi:MAG: biopolymer transporter ExbD [Spirochaetaceae bacterium]|jgi:biopolymer transport protein ExbD|nr:biopolymer transporter ExbD [Spirochaetaceae bacterium]